MLHVDMDQFFCSVERQVNPKLSGVPLVVTGSRKKRSVVAAASYEVRKFGVKAGMSLPEAKRRCPGLTLVPADIHRYTHALRRVVVLATGFTPLVEISSIDELALDVTDIISHHSSPRELAADLQGQVRDELGLACSIGIAENKLLAKFACGINKPNGLTALFPSQVPSKLFKLPANKMPRIGEKVAEHLSKMDIRTCGQLGRASRARLRARFGVIGDILLMVGQGVDRRPVIPYWSDEPIKSVGNSLTLPRDEFEPKEIDRVLLWLSERVGRRLRGEGYVGRRVATMVRYPNFFAEAHSHALQRYVDDGGDIYRCARLLLPAQVVKRGVRMLAVSVSMLSKGVRPLHLFEQRRDRLTEVIDMLNEDYGRDCCVRAALLSDAPGSGLFEEHFG